ncbi:hypothetical protein [Methanosarcina mazei]|uniref:hypothetical protein n=1 Tax=Methanosarcina mazei TaxID=2209 RepID=UPI0012D3B6AD|nr:hypothetical protein [Methanosarcina mazei]
MKKIVDALSGTRWFENVLRCRRGRGRREMIWRDFLTLVLEEDYALIEMKRLASLLYFL